MRRPLTFGNICIRIIPTYHSDCVGPLWGRQVEFARWRTIVNSQIEKIARGNTVAGTNAEVILTIEAILDDKRPSALLDCPCGNGEFLDAVAVFFPWIKRHGIDIQEPAPDFRHEFLLADARRFPDLESRKFRFVTSISGVMEFDGTLDFFKALREILEDDGILIVTNDNLLSVRDRLLYLFFGRYRQYRNFVPLEKGTWKTLSMDNLARCLHDAGFEVVGIRYVPCKTADWLWSPIAIPLYFLQRLYLYLSEKTELNYEIDRRFSFRSFLSRHYIVVCRPML